VIGSGVTVTPVVGSTVLPEGMDVALVIVEGAVITAVGGIGFSVESLGIGRFASPGMEVVGPMPTPGPGPELRTGVLLTPSELEGDTVVVVVVVVVVEVPAPCATAALAYSTPRTASIPVRILIVMRSLLSA
jgi:hypothetical protein